MMRGFLLLLLVGATPVWAQALSRHDPFSKFYGPTEMFLNGKRSASVQYGIEKGAERTHDEFTFDQGDLNGRFSDVHLILTDEGQRLQVGAFHSIGTNKYEGTSTDHVSLNETSIGNRTDYSIVGIDLASRFNESWLWAMRVQTVRYTLRFRFDEYSGSMGATGYSIYSPSFEWREGPWAVRLSYQPTVNYVDRYPVRLAGHTKLTLTQAWENASWSGQLIHHRERALEKENIDSYQLLLGGDQRRGSWGWDGYASYQTKAWKKAEYIKTSTLAQWGGGLGAKWLKSEDLTVGLRLETERAPRVSGLGQGSKFEADLIKDTINLYVDYVIDAPKIAAVSPPPTP